METYKSFPIFAPEKKQQRAAILSTIKDNFLTQYRAKKCGSQFFCSLWPRPSLGLSLQCRPSCRPWLPQKVSDDKKKKEDIPLPIPRRVISPAAVHYSSRARPIYYPAQMALIQLVWLRCFWRRRAEFPCEFRKDYLKLKTSQTWGPVLNLALSNFTLIPFALTDMAPLWSKAASTPVFGRDGIR